MTKLMLILFSVSLMYDLSYVLLDIIESNDIVSDVKRLNQSHQSQRIYKPEWKDLDTRPLPEWYDRAKIGIFVHWGVYSVPSFKDEWFMANLMSGDEGVMNFMKDHYPHIQNYREFANMFTGIHFDPDEWAALFAKAGAKYVVFTSKHHDGFAMYPAETTPIWNSVDMGPKRDVVGELAEAVRKFNMKFGVYHAMLDWHDDHMQLDQSRHFMTHDYIYNKLWPDIQQLIYNYSPSVLWLDGHWVADETYFKTANLLTWLYNESPVKAEIVVNDRLDQRSQWRHGDFFNGEDRFNPGTLPNHKWESAISLDKTSWGYRRNMASSQVLTISELMKNMVSAVSCGGNILINVGPTKEGTIPEIFKERLLALGKWLEVNGVAIYDSSPWLHQADSRSNGTIWYTCKKMIYNILSPIAMPTRKDTVLEIFAITLEWPEDNILRMRDIARYLQSRIYKVELLGNEGNYLNWTISQGGANIQLPDRKNTASKLAWTLRFTKISTTYYDI